MGEGGGSKDALELGRPSRLYGICDRDNGKSSIISIVSASVRIGYTPGYGHASTTLE